MGFINLLISFTRVNRHGTDFSDVKIDPGGGALKTAEHFEDPGGDSHPLPDDYVATVQHLGAGGVSAVGYLDPVNKPKAAPGEKIIYSRNVNGVLIAELWLKADGTAILSNENGSFELRPDGSMKGANSNGSFELENGGDFLVNTVRIDTGGNITATSVTAPSIKVGVTENELAEHIHGGVESGGSTTGPNLP